MSAHDQIRAMLDELMGTSRDGEESRYKLKFDDPRVCRSFLLNCCPHDILASTRMDLGECHKTHDLALRADFEAASRSKDYFFDIDAMDHLEGFVADCDRRTEQAARRLKETQEELSEEANEKAQVIHQLGEQIGTKLAAAEAVGAEGRVDESLTLLEEVEQLKKQKSAAESEFRNSMPASSYQQQKLRVCEICSAYLGIHDNDRRLADHFGGKLHLGFITIREKLAELKSAVADRRAMRDAEREARRMQRDAELLERRQRSRSVSKSPADNRVNNKVKAVERDEARDRGDREDYRRDRSRRDRSHSRSRNRRHRSRSRSRDRYRRKKGRSRRDRSRSREYSRRHRRSRSRSRSRQTSESRRGGRTDSASHHDPYEEEAPPLPPDSPSYCPALPGAAKGRGDSNGGAGAAGAAGWESGSDEGEI